MSLELGLSSNNGSKFSIDVSPVFLYKVKIRLLIEKAFANANKPIIHNPEKCIMYIHIQYF